MVWRKMVAEFIGTFALVFVGCGAIISQGVLEGIKVTAGVVEVNPPLPLDYCSRFRIDRHGGSLRNW